MVDLREVQIQTMAEPAKIKLIKYAKVYDWEISLYAETLFSCIETIKLADKRLKELYGDDTHEEQKT